MEPYTVRLAGAADLDIILHHRRRMFEDMGYRDPEAVERMLRSSRPLIGRGLGDGAYRGWLVEHPMDGVVAGGGVITLEFQSHPRDPEPRRSWVVNMYTELAHRRRGLARAVMDAILKDCRAAGLRSLFLHASDDGRGLYESVGFAPTNEMRREL